MTRLGFRDVLVAAVVVCGCAGGEPAGSGTTTGASSGPPLTTLPPPTTGITVMSDDTADASSGEDTQSQGDSTTAAGPACPSTHRCVADVPEGWEGPGMAIWAGSEEDPPECDDLYPDDGAAGFQDLVAPQASCGCDCADAVGAACDTSTTLRYWGTADECNVGSPTQFTLFGVICNNLPSAFPGNAYWQVGLIEASGGECEPIAEVMVEDPNWETQVKSCAGAELLDGLCEVGEVCAPEPEVVGAELCIWRTGEHACPEGYGNPATVYEAVVDARGCQPCSCGDPVGVCDEARVTVFENFNCGVPLANIFAADEECKAGTGVTARAAILDTGDPSTFCAPSDPAPVGEATGGDPTTVCCAGR
jgi:hypothetical protein